MIRMDFVSNSSSSSFVLKTKKDMLDKTTYKKFLSFFSEGEKFNVREYENCIRTNLVWSIFDFEFLKDLNKDGKYDHYYNIPPMEYLDNDMGERIEDILQDVFKDQSGGFETDGCFFYHEDFVFQHRGIAQITRKSVEYTRKILKMIKDEGFSFTLYDPKFCAIKNHLVKVPYKGEDGKDYLRATEYKSIEEAEEFLDKLDKELQEGVNYIVIAMSYQGDGTDNGKLWYDKDWDNEKSCYVLIKENDFGETFYIDW